MTHTNTCSHFASPVLLVVFIFTSIFSFAKNTGVVLDGKSDKPLMVMNVYSNITGTLAVTNLLGEYTIRNMSGMDTNDTVYFSYIGYITKKISIPELK
jgi:hypothetical protein